MKDGNISFKQRETVAKRLIDDLNSSKISDGMRKAIANRVYRYFQEKVNKKDEKK